MNFPYLLTSIKFVTSSFTMTPYPCFVHEAIEMYVSTSQPCPCYECDCMEFGNRFTVRKNGLSFEVL